MKKQELIAQIKNDRVELLSLLAIVGIVFFVDYADRTNKQQEKVPQQVQTDSLRHEIVHRDSIIRALRHEKVK